MPSHLISYCIVCNERTGDLQVMNVLSPNEQKVEQQRGRLCFDKTGEIEAAAPVTWSQAR